ncbi:Transmembrane And Coiled-Coil Domains Protein 1 [Manis pentadactyla]|nr:Transmembrane And Coiled-Coil Domains Protein 1 [Manis pentadactyla]
MVSKPRDIGPLIWNQFGSADSIPNLKDSEEGQVDDGGTALGVISNFQSSPRYGSEEDCFSATSGSVRTNGPTGGIAVEASSTKTNTQDVQSSELDALFHEIQEIREAQAGLEEPFETLKEHYQRNYSLVIQALQEERYRCLYKYIWKSTSKRPFSRRIAYRIGQCRDVKVLRLISLGTMEEFMYLRQVYKQQLHCVVVGSENARRYFEAVQGSKQH